ncbi:MAG: hypothetical protein J2O48_10195, partial [Solirubrobacterales bacterium]|nr:hypothetical protein [Solirubrobacterales bacterium]
DVVELREGPAWRVLGDAQAILAPIAKALGPGAEIVLVPGNHDHELLQPWLTRRALSGNAPALELDTGVDWREGEPLALLADVLGAHGAKVTVSYPGIWLRDDVYAMHGHYLDRHNTVPAFERLAAGAMAKFLKSPLTDAKAPGDYEAVLGPIYSWMFSVAQSGHAADLDKLDSVEGPSGLEAGLDSRERSTISVRVWKLLNEGEGVPRMLAAGGVSAVTGLLTALGLGPLKAEVNGEELYRSGVRSFSKVLDTLAVHPRYAIYGHTHRAGPLPGDDRDLWVTAGGTRLLNTGCWVSEEAFLGPDLSASAYRAGFAVRIDDSAAPELVNLLD